MRDVLYLLILLKIRVVIYAGALNWGDRLGGLRVGDHQVLDNVCFCTLFAFLARLVLGRSWLGLGKLSCYWGFGAGLLRDLGFLH